MVENLIEYKTCPCCKVNLLITDFRFKNISESLR